MIGHPARARHRSRHDIRVWDPWVRLFHWMLVVAVLVAWMAGEAGLAVHVVAGYTVFGLVTWRTGWGFAGPATARFRNFVRPPGEIRAFLLATLRGRPPHHAGHNPAGGAMVVLLLALLLLTTLTGMALYGAQDAGGPLAFLDGLASFRMVDVLEAAHEFLGNFLPWLIAMHVAGASWQRILSGLEVHFGDNAELEPAVQRKLTAYLVAHSAERSHLRRARAVARSTGDSTPLRITETRWFRHEHDEISARWVKGNDEVRRFSQCDACHRDAARGLFDEDNVTIPGHGRWDD